MLDDFQLIEDSTISDAMEFLLDNLPANLHLVIASRSDPLLPVARMRVMGELTELRAADLRFTEPEAAAFLNDAMGLDSLPRRSPHSMRARKAGSPASNWPALSMRDNEDVPGFIAGFTGSHRFVIDYLVEEVLSASPTMCATSSFRPRSSTASAVRCAMRSPRMTVVARCS